MKKLAAKLGRPRWHLVASAIAAALLLAGSTLAATFVPVPRKLPELALNSPWFFRGEVFVAVLFAASIAWKVVSSVLSGRPLEKIGAGPFSIEGPVAQTVAALFKDGQDLEAASQTDDNPAFDEAMARLRTHLAELKTMTDEEGVERV